MPPATRRQILPIQQLTTEWHTLGRSAPAVRALHRLAESDQELARLVHGSGPSEPSRCPTPYDLIDHMRLARGRVGREKAAAVVRVMLREAAADPLIVRFLLQALVPGLLAVAGRLQWGQGGDWEDGNDFFGELLSTTWVVLDEWSGQDRPFAVLDLLSAVRCRMRRQLFRAKDHRLSQARLTTEVVSTSTASSETDLEQLARTLIDLRRHGMRAEEVEVLYAHHVLGFSISELAKITGRERRALYLRRDRGQRRLCA